MLISIIIATYNASKTLSHCLESIVSQMTEECELLVIDGGSTDGTQNIIEEYKDHIAYTISEQDAGVYDAWNKGIKAARGKWITFIGSDDEMISGTINTYKTFVKNIKDDIYLVCGKIHFVDRKGRILRDVGEPFDWYKLVHRTLKLAHPGLLHNRKCFEQFGLFNCHYKICADSEFLQRLGPDSQTAFIDDFFVNMAEGGVSDSYKAICESFLIRYHNKTLKLSSNIWGFVRSTMFFIGGKVKRCVTK